MFMFIVFLLLLMLAGADLFGEYFNLPDATQKWIARTLFILLFIVAAVKGLTVFGLPV
jgi:hypothetical protein